MKQSSVDQQQARLQPLPDWAELIFSSRIQKEIGPLGIASVELYAADSKGEQTIRVTWDRWSHNHFAVSPDRRFIACNRYAEDSNGDGILDYRDLKRLWVLDLEAGRQWELLPEFDAGWGGIDWSPDGQWIYAALSEPGKLDTTHIYRFHPDGSGLQNLTLDIERRLGIEPGRRHLSDPGVSPDGEWLCHNYTMWLPDGSGRKSRITRTRIEGGPAGFVTDGGPLPPQIRGIFGIGDFDSEFAPDGQRLVFSRATDVAFNMGPDGIPNKTSYDVMTVAKDGSDLRALTPPRDPALKGIPDWSHDNRIVYFVLDDRDDYMGPEIVNADGTDRHRLPSVVGTHFRWIPPPPTR